MKQPNRELLEKKAEKARVKLELSVEDAQLIRQTCYGLYGYFGYDLPAETKRGTIKRASLIEVCLDAGRLRQALAGEMGASFKKTPQGAALAEILSKAEYQTLIDLVGSAFTYAEYEAGPAE